MHSRDENARGWTMHLKRWGAEILQLVRSKSSFWKDEKLDEEDDF